MSKDMECPETPSPLPSAEGLSFFDPSPIYATPPARKPSKLEDAYHYLEIKSVYEFEKKAFLLLSLADKQSLLKYGRTVTGCELPIQEPVEMGPYVIDQDCPFGNLSRSDMMCLDRVFLDYADLRLNALECAVGPAVTCLEDVFKDVPEDEAKDMMELIREQWALSKVMRDTGFCID